MKGILNEAQSERFEQMQKPRMHPNRPQMQRRRVDFRNGPQLKQPPFHMQRGGQIQPSREQIMRKRKMFDDVQQPEQAPQADAGVEMSDLTANNNIMTNVISLDMMASVEADLLG